MPQQVTEEFFGKTKDGKDVKRYTLKNNSGNFVVRILDYGGAITEIHVPDREGKLADITPGFDDFADYESRNPYFGVINGRVAARTAGGQFTLDGTTYQLPKNWGQHSIHGGNLGFDKRLWRGKVEGDRLVLTYVSADGEEGYPGELTTTVTYRVTDDNELFIEYEATTTKPTPVNLTNHAFFNLAGHDAANMDDHLLTVPADTFLPQDEDFVPTGEVKRVEGTVWDLRKPARLGERIPQIPGGRGINENYCLPPNDSGKLQLAARFEHPPSGRYMECLTTEPGMQVYTGYFLDVPRAKAGATYGRFGAIVLEAQHYPDSVHRPSFPNTILRPGETYRQTTIYKFGVA